MIRRGFIIAVLVFLLVPSAVRTNETVVNIMALSGTTGLTLVKMIEDNPSLGRGVRAEYTIVRSPDIVVAKLISKEADIAAIPTSTAALLRNRGIPIQIAAVTNLGVMYVVGREPLSEWKDLKGKEVAIPGRGTTPDVLFRYLLSANGLNPDRDVRIQYYPSPAELAQVVIAGRARYAALPEPWVTEVLKKDAGVRVVLDYQEEWKRVEKRAQSYPQSAIVVRAEFAKANPGIVREFMKHAAESSDWVVKNPAAAGVLAETHVQISRAAALDAIPRCNLVFVKADRAEIEHYLSRILAFEPESIGGKLPDADFYWKD